MASYAEEPIRVVPGQGEYSGPTVMDQIDHNDKMLNLLHESMAKLEDRLGPILIEGSKDDRVSESPSMTSGLATIHYRLDSQFSDINLAIAKVENLTRRAAL